LISFFIKKSSNNTIEGRDKPTLVILFIGLTDQPVNIYRGSEIGEYQPSYVYSLRDYPSHPIINSPMEYKKSA